MPTDLPIRCSCAALRGVARGVSGARGNRIVCYCDDCQSYAHALGGADQLLDAHGGTDVFQMSAARLEITQGPEHLACLRLKPGGLLRWYADCCRSPIGNSLASRQMPFVGLLLSCTDPASAGRSRDEALGPVRARIQARFAKGERSQLDAHDTFPTSQLFRFVPLLLLWRLRGDQKRSPFWNQQTGQPIAQARVLSAEELRAAEAARDAS